VFVNAILDAIGGQLTNDNIGDLNADQITLLAYHFLHEEVMDGGFVQLIHNGYGAFIYLNPTDKAFREWGIPELYRLINKSHRYYSMYHETIDSRWCTERSDMILLHHTHDLFCRKLLMIKDKYSCSSKPLTI